MPRRSVRILAWAKSIRYGRAHLTHSPAIKRSGRVFTVPTCNEARDNQHRLTGPAVPARSPMTRAPATTHRGARGARHSHRATTRTHDRTDTDVASPHPPPPALPANRPRGPGNLGRAPRLLRLLSRGRRCHHRGGR